MSDVDQSSNLARKLRDAGYDPDRLAALPPEEKRREGELGVKGLPDPNNEHAHASSRAELGTGPFQRASVATLKEEAAQVTPLQRRLAYGKKPPGTSELRPPMREGSRSKG